MSKNVFYFFPENPFTKSAGNISRAFSTLCMLKKLDYEIDLVGLNECYKSLEVDENSIDYSIVSNFYLISRKPKKNKLSFNYWKHKTLRLFKYNKNYYKTDYLKENLNNLLKIKKYDVIFINYEFIAECIDFKDLHPCLKVIDTHDWITLNEFYKIKNFNIGNYFNQELKNLNNFNKIITISNDEYYVFSNFLGKERVVNIPISFPEKYSNSKTSVKDRKYDLLFIGSDNTFNKQGIKWFLDKVYPLIKRELNVLFIGKICNFIEDRINFTKILHAESLENYYYNSKVAICPMLEGTGLKIKVVEALSFGLPIIGTEKAVDGFAFKQKNGCLVTNEHEKFAKLTTELLNDHKFYEEVKNQAIEYFNEYFSEEVNFEKWKKVLN